MMLFLFLICSKLRERLKDVGHKLKDEVVHKAEDVGHQIKDEAESKLEDAGHKLEDAGHKAGNQLADVVVKGYEALVDKGKAETKRVWRKVGHQVESWAEQICFVLRHSTESQYANPAMVFGYVGQSETEKYMNEAKDAASYDFGDTVNTKAKGDEQSPCVHQGQAIIEGDNLALLSSYGLYRIDTNTHEFRTQSVYNDTEITEEGQLAVLHKYEVIFTVQTDATKKDGTVDEYRKLTPEEIEQLVRMFVEHIKKAMKRLVKQIF
ncbi:hypothetical protein TVAGG3_0013360 [Trichomonas vaginalis G3]|nr:hypothetical protein TVAGG3_0013360 [Trichomonas vaginalis G3]KAI5539261.1 hypothetical protein TVAGG3_0013360 [Trichomonas vaginalis G3]